MMKMTDVCGNDCFNKQLPQAVLQMIKVNQHQDELEVIN